MTCGDGVRVSVCALPTQLRSLNGDGAHGSSHRALTSERERRVLAAASKHSVSCSVAPPGSGVGAGRAGLAHPGVSTVMAAAPLLSGDFTVRFSLPAARRGIKVSVHS